MKERHVTRPLLLSTAVAASLAACSPTVKLQAPTEPITINLNVKIDQEVRIKLDKEVEDLIASNPDIF
jgi:type IV pilus biogenesis protein CpaD/CtpE